MMRWRAFSLSTAGMGFFLPLTGGTLSGALLIANGTVGAPAIALSSDTTTGLYKSGSSSASRTTSWGVTTGGINVLNVFAWDVKTTLDGVVLGIGRPSQVFTNTGEHYLASLYAPVCSGSGAGVSVFGANIFGLGFTATDTVTKTNIFGGMEFDKVDLTAGAGAVTFNAVTATRFRMPLAHVNVTIAENLGITFTIPEAAEALGTTTNSYLIEFPAAAGGSKQASNYYGLMFNSGYTQHIMSRASIPLLIGSGAGITINAATGNTIDLQNDSLTLLQIQNVGGAHNYWSMSANNQPSLAARGSGAVSAGISAAGGGAVAFYTASELSGLQVSVEHTASADRYMKLTGSNGGNPTIGVSAGKLAVSAALVLSQTTLLETSATLTNGAAAQVGTLTNAPTAGNPTKWIPINDNGTTRYLPAW